MKLPLDDTYAPKQHRLSLNERYVDNKEAWDAAAEFCGGTARFRIMAWAITKSTDEILRVSDMQKETGYATGWRKVMERLEKHGMVSRHRVDSMGGGLRWQRLPSPYWDVVIVLCKVFGLETGVPTAEEVADAREKTRRLARRLSRG
jgi:hypothetical protein